VDLREFVAVLHLADPKHAKHWAKQPIIVIDVIIRKYNNVWDILTAISFNAVMHWSRPVRASKFSGLNVTTGKVQGQLSKSTR
jgi:hypothetical protein